MRPYAFMILMILLPATIWTQSIPNAKLEIESPLFGDHLRLIRTSAGFMNITTTDPLGLAITDSSNQTYFQVRQDLQNVGILTNNPLPSAALEIKSAVKGFLVPRMSSGSRTNIPNPAEGLLVYDLNTLSFWYFQNGVWVDLTKVNRAFENNNGVVSNSGDQSNDDFVFGSPTLDFSGNSNHFSRFFFDKSKVAFRAGSSFVQGSVNDDDFWDEDSLGYASFAMGEGNLVSGFAAAGWGKTNRVIGDGATVWGFSNQARGNLSTIWGESNVVTGYLGSSWGIGNVSSDSLSTVWGMNNRSEKKNSTAWGENNFATSEEATAWGRGNEASGPASTAWGFSNTATGLNATAWGGSNTSSATVSTTWGNANVARRTRSTAFGSNNMADGNNATAWGQNNKAQSHLETVFGAYADTLDHSNPVAWEPDDFLLVVGNGTSLDNRANALTILKNGKMGLNITEPNQDLTIFDKDSVGSAIIRLFSSTGSSPDLLLGFNLSNGPFLRTSSNHALKFQTGGANSRMIIDADGEVGIGTTNPTQLLDVNGNARFRAVGDGASTKDLRLTSDGTLTTNTSDIRLKENIQTIDQALEKVINLRGVSFTWKEDPEAGPQHGLIAQEVLKVVPELVHKNGEHYGVDYSEMVGLFVEAIKEQQELIYQQKSLLIEFAGRIEKLENRSALETPSLSKK